MCFFNLDKDTKKPIPHKIAEEDLTCYKVVWYVDKRHYVSEYQYHHHHVGETYTADKFPLDYLDQSAKLNGGVFHSYAKKNISLYIDKCGYGGAKRVIECIIPKGTPYWHNESHNEYASTSIMVVREVEDKEFFIKLRY